jgi:hypothetical protein
MFMRFLIIFESKLRNMTTRKLRRQLLLTVLIGSLVTGFASCTKEDDDPVEVENTIQGLWIGSYTVNGQPGLGQQYFSLVFKPDGGIIYEGKAGGQQHLNVGTYTLTGGNFVATTTCVYGLAQNIGVQQEITGEFDKATGTIRNGQWKSLNPAGTGNFVVEEIE